MAQTVLITGSSTGIGKATAKHFRDQGWNVVATMRTPERETELKDAGNVMLARLDVTDADSIQAAIDAGLARFGRIDAVVNNAGYGLTGSFESMTLERIRRQFETNVFGLMEVTRRILPHFRAHKAGTVINVASMGGRLTFPFYSVYHATKWAVDGFSESLQFELRPLGIRVKIVEPGAIKTDFYDRSVDLAHDRALSEYNALVDKAMRRMNAAGEKGASPEIVARAIYRAATDGSWRLRYPVGSDARSMLALRRLLPDGAWQAMIRHALLR
jgi:NAD(P)-dependent dehydrogenase (short-subunit alcohol dehydrogenase family)